MIPPPARGAPPRRTDGARAHAGPARQAPPVSRDRLAAIERRKARARILKTVIAVILIMLVTMLLIMTILQKSRPKPRFQFIQNGSIVHAVEAQALIIREETLLTAPAKGAFRPLAAEGVRVSAGEKVAMVIRPGMEETLVSLNNCDQQIAEIQLELMDKGNAAPAKAIYDETNADIVSLVRLIRRDSSDGVLSNTGMYASSLSLLVEGRESRMLSVDFQDARLDQLSSQRAKLAQQLGTNAGSVSSTSPGIVSYRLDGLETVLTPAMSGTMTLQAYRSYLTGTAGYASVPAQVEANAKIVRVSNGLVQYLVIFIRGAQAAWFEPGSLHNVSIPAEGVVIEDCSVVSAAAAEDGVFVTLKSDRQVARLFDRRVVTCDITVPSLTTAGLRVPASALVKDGDSAWVLVIHSGFARRAAIRILDSDRSYAIIEPLDGNPYALRASSIVVVNPESVTEGEKVGE